MLHRWTSTEAVQLTKLYSCVVHRYLLICNMCFCVGSCWSSYVVHCIR